MNYAFKDAYDNGPRATILWLPDCDTVDGASGWAYFDGIVNGRAEFKVADTYEPVTAAVWHEAGHCAHTVAAIARDAAEGLGTAGDDIIREVGAILCPGYDIMADTLRHEYVAEAFRKAFTGGLTVHYYPHPPLQVAPFPTDALRSYFTTMNNPRRTTMTLDEKVAAFWTKLHDVGRHRVRDRFSTESPERPERRIFRLASQ